MAKSNNNPILKLTLNYTTILKHSFMNDAIHITNSYQCVAHSRLARS